jgi:MFS family permease
MTPSVFVAGILTFLWPHVHGTGVLVTVALLYGTSIGAFASLIGAPMMALGDSTDVGRRTGMYLTVLSFGSLMGPPTSGAINRATGGYSTWRFKCEKDVLGRGGRKRCVSTDDVLLSTNLGSSAQKSNGPSLPLPMNFSWLAGTGLQCT